MRNSAEGVSSINVPGARASQISLLVGEMDGMHRGGRGDILSRQSSQLTNTVRWHAHSNARFMDRLRDSGLRDDGIGHGWLQGLKPLTRREWQDAGESMFNDSVPTSHGRIYEMSTSGSTGEPVSVHRTDLNGMMWAAHAMLDHSWNGRDLSGRLMAVRGDIHERHRGGDWGFPASMLAETGEGIGIPITTDVSQLLAEMDEFGPNVLLIYPSMLRPCLLAWESGRTPPAGIRHIKTIGETVDGDLRDLAMRVLGLRIEDTYSSNEVGTMAICCEHGSYHEMSESVIVEILDDDGNHCLPGQIGRVVVTDLLNWATPIIRYDIGDWAIRGDSCACGRHSGTMLGVMGRTRNLVALPDGRRYWPLTGFKKFSGIAPIRQYQVVQHGLDDVELRLVCEEELSSDQEASIISLVQGFLGHPFPIRITRQAIPFSLARNGKHEEFICEVT